MKEVKLTLQVLTDRIQECRGYQRSMIIVDLDSLAGISVSESMSGMGPSTSFNFVNQKMLTWCLDVFNRLLFDEVCYFVGDVVSLFLRSVGRSFSVCPFVFPFIRSFVSSCFG